MIYGLRKSLFVVFTFTRNVPLVYGLFFPGLSSRSPLLRGHCALSSRRSHSSTNENSENADIRDILENELFTKALESVLFTMKGLMMAPPLDQGGSLLRHPQDTVHVRPSSIPNAGQGLFAKPNTHIKKGTIVSFYPVDGIGVEWRGMTDTDICSEVVIASLDAADQDYFQICSEAQTSDQNNTAPNYRHYFIGNRPLGNYTLTSNVRSSLFIDVNPNNRQDNASTATGACWCSHCINDGAVVDHNTEQDILDYYNTSLKRQNCLQIPFGSTAPLMATITIRDILPNEELFTSYGSAYWLEGALGVSSPFINLEIQESSHKLLDGIQEAKSRYASEWSYLGNLLANGSNTTP